MEVEAGFSEVEHTADWELEVWAPDFPILLEQAALGMLSLSGTILDTAQRIPYVLHVRGSDRESLLVKFLSELLHLIERERLGFDRFSFQVEGSSLSVSMEGAQILSHSKEIKAVTYHNLSIRESGNGFRVNIVFDV